MHKFTEYLKREFRNSEIGFQELGEAILSYPFDQIEYQHLLDKNIASEGYTRIPLIDSPLEVTLIHWPAGAESAIHWHQGFYGYVLVLNGQAEDITYLYKDGRLCRKSRGIFFKNGLLAEPDQVIHKIINGNKQQTLTSLHLYYPAIKEFAGMKLFNIEACKIGTLSPNAKNASWSTAEDHFSDIKTKAFTYENTCHNRSHESVMLCPKPDVPTIQSMIAAYYNEQANEYDSFDTSHISRCMYTDAVDQWIIAGLNKLSECKHMIDIACGTGRRSADIVEQCIHHAELSGVDMSENMLLLAKERGIQTLKAPFTQAVLPHNLFDVATYLYAFGHIPTKDLRVKTLKSIHSILKPGGSFFGDFFNLENKNEWGPDALKQCEDHKLQNFGYEPGDIFYSKTGGKAVAYLHYFREHELTSMFQQCGFKIAELRYIGYVNNPGVPVSDRTMGNILIHAIKA